MMNYGQKYIPGALVNNCISHIIGGYNILSMPRDKCCLPTFDMVFGWCIPLMVGAYALMDLQQTTHQERFCFHLPFIYYR